MEAWEDPPPLRVWRILSCMPSREAQWTGSMGGSDPSPILEDTVLHALSGGAVDWRHGRIHPLYEFGGSHNPQSRSGACVGSEHAHLERTRLWGEHAYGVARDALHKLAKKKRKSVELRGTPRNSRGTPAELFGVFFSCSLKMLPGI